MDPFQATAARHVRPTHKSEAEEIDAFYEDNAFESLLVLRNAVSRFARLLRSAPRRLARPRTEIATAPRRA